MPRPKANLVVLDPGSGKARPGAMVSIYLANTTTFAALFADDDVTTLSNPIAANGLGQVSVRLSQGTYDVSMTFEGALPNVVEDVAIMDPSSTGSSIPGSIVIGGDPNTVLAVGANGQVLTVVNGMPAWATGGGGGGTGAGLPAGPTGSLFTYDATVQAAIISPGLQGQALAMQGGMPTWVSSLLPPGSTLPISAPGDLVVGAVTTGAVARLPRGNTGDVLTTASTGGLAWSPSTGGGGGDGTGDKGGGNCVLVYTAPNLVLTPFKGNGLWVNGAERIIPDAGLPLAPTGLSANTTYWIYASVAGTTLALEASLTQPVYANGFFTKTGDPSRTFVGMARTIAGPSWVYNDRQLFIYNFFHPSPRRTMGIFTANRTVNFSASTEVHPEIKVEYLTFGNAQVSFNLSGMMYPDPGITIVAQSVFVELMGSEGLVVGNLYDLQTNFDWTNIAMATQLVPTFAGYHWVTLNCWGQPAATVSFKGETAGKYTCRLMVNAD